MRTIYNGVVLVDYEAVWSVSKRTYEGLQNAAEEYAVREFLAGPEEFSKVASNESEARENYEDILDAIGVWVTFDTTI